MRVMIFLMWAGVGWMAGVAGMGGQSYPPEVIGCGSCAEQNKAQGFWDPILKVKPKVFLWMGDNVYAVDHDLGSLQAAYTKLGAQRGFQFLKRSTTFLATWDDHDYGVNDGGADFAGREMAEKMFEDFWEYPAGHAVRGRPGVFNAVEYEGGGRRLQIILLDTRFFRSPLEKGNVEGGPRYRANTEAGATVLGAEQWQWLETQLRRPADVRLVVSSIQVIPEDHGFEKWANFPAERARLFRLFAETEAGGILLLSGDRHRGEISRLPRAETGMRYDLYEMTSSGLNQGWVADGLVEPNRWRVGPQQACLDHFGVVRIRWQEKDGPGVSAGLLDLENRPLAGITLAGNQLR